MAFGPADAIDFCCSAGNAATLAAALMETAPLRAASTTAGTASCWILSTFLTVSWERPASFATSARVSTFTGAAEFCGTVPFLISEAS
ncbi:hypothetical protein D3C72_2431100 [compost metagenome]